MLSKAVQEEVIAFTQEVVRINSLSGHEGEVAQAIERKMRSLAYDRVQVDPYGSVIAWRYGAHPGPTILFDAHMDVVPVTTPETWGHAAFSGEIADNKIWGRGASDMKGPLAAAVVALGRVPKDEISGTLAISTSIGEEQHEGAALEQVMQVVKPDFVVICEPNGCCLGLGQKGRAGLWVDVCGKPAHSSVPHLGDNAVYKGVKVIERLREMDLPKDEFLGAGIIELIDAVSRPLPSRSTVPVGFTLHYDRRLMAGESMETILITMRAALANLPDWDLGFEQVTIDCYTGNKLVAPDYHPGWITDQNSPWVQKAIRSLIQAGIEPKVTAAQFCTNGSYSAGIAKVPTMIFGPSSGLLAHCMDEYIQIDELLSGAEGYWALARELGK